MLVFEWWSGDVVEMSKSWTLLEYILEYTMTILTNFEKRKKKIF